MSALQTLVAFLVALTILIFVHELGHYLVARWCGVKVLRFSIGFGKPFLTWRVGADRTEWSLAAIPLGGYVKMLDEREQATETIDPKDLPRAFTRKSLGQRAAIVAAGPIANFLLAIALYAGINTVGTEEPAGVVAAPPAGSAAAAAGFAAGDRIVRVDGHDAPSWNEVRLRMLDGVIERRPISIVVEREAAAPATLNLDPRSLGDGEVERDFLRTLGLDLEVGRVLIGSLAPGSEAAAAGLQVGDAIDSIAGIPVKRSQQVIDQVRDRPGEALPIQVTRGDVALSMQVVPALVVSERPEDNGRKVGRIGAGLQNRVAMVQVRHGPIDAVAKGVKQTWDMSVFSLRMLGKMVIGELSLKNLSGPVTIADYAGQTARIGWHAYVSFLALISISLGVLNLLPIPVLDGGHLVYYGLEAIRGRPLSERFLAITQKAGLAVIVLMMVIALFNDISRLIGS